MIISFSYHTISNPLILSFLRRFYSQQTPFSFTPVPSSGVKLLSSNKFPGYSIPSPLILPKSNSPRWRRFHNVNGHTVIEHIKTNLPKNWFEYFTVKNMVIVALLSTVIVNTLSDARFEKIPYSKRTHFVILPCKKEKKMGDSCFKDQMESYKKKILPQTHPDSIWVRTIAYNVVNALLMGIHQQHVWYKLGFWGKVLKTLGWHTQISATETQIQLVNKTQLPPRIKAAIDYIQGLEWDVVLIDEPSEENAFCVPGGKIVVFTGLLRKFKLDDEIATIIGREVGHAVARHSAETYTKDKMEEEADYIGLLLIASAGYDPRVAPGVYEKLGGASSRAEKYFSTHPSGNRRAKLLEQGKVMEEAVSVYKKVTRLKAGRGDTDMV